MGQRFAQLVLLGVMLVGGLAFGALIHGAVLGDVGCRQGLLALAPFSLFALGVVVEKAGL